MEDKPLLTEREVADLVAISASTLRHYRRQGRGPRWVQIGKHVRYVEDDVRAWLTEARREAGQ